MKGWVTAIVTLALVGVGGVVLSMLLNRKAVRSSEDARETLRKNANALDDRDVNKFLLQCGLIGRDASASLMLIQFLAGLLKVPPAKLAGDYKMRNLFRLQVKENNKKTQSGVELEPFAYDLVEGISMRCDKQLWDEQFTESLGLPNNEEKIADFIMRMSIVELLKFFVPLMRV